MHSSDYGNVTFHYNSDLSGEVIIQVRLTKTQTTEVQVEGKYLVAFVMDWVRNQLIDTLEQIDTEKIWSRLLRLPGRGR